MSVAVKQICRLKWDETYSVGVERFDKQHIRLMEFINTLRDSTMGKKAETAEVIEKILMELLDYCVSHFLEEEVALYKTDYPYFSHHQELHNKFLMAVRDLYVRFKVGTTSPRMMSSEMIAFLTEFLQVHILGEDQLYTLFLNEKGIK